MSRQRHVLACDTATRCAESLIGQLPVHIPLMGPAELRGYVRARAAPFVRAEVQQAISDGCLPANQVDELVVAVLDRTIQAVIRGLQISPVVAIPAPHVMLRPAA